MGTKNTLKAVLAVVAVLFSITIAQGNFTETVDATNNISIDMIYVEGGTYTRGCTSGDNGCESTEKTPHEVTLSSFYISKYIITQDMFWAVMGWIPSGAMGDSKSNARPSNNSRNVPVTSIDWYDAVDFTCALSTKTGKKYRLITDAEFEYAARGGKNGNHSWLYSGSNDASEVARYSGNGSGNAVGSLKPNQLGTYDQSGLVYEWMWDNWESSFSSSAKTDPAARHKHMQKTRRGGSSGQPMSESRVSGRKIRSIDGKDGEIGMRLALSNEDVYPGEMTNPCSIEKPKPTAGKEGYRDDRLITADDEVWAPSGGYGNMFVIKENGAAIAASVYGNYVTTDASGEWYTHHNFSLYIKPTSGEAKKYIYLPMCGSEGCNDMSLMPEGGMPGRYERKKRSEVSGAPTAPTINSPTSIEQLAGTTAIDMSNPPTNGRDPRLLHGTGYTWLQDNVATGAGGTHRYRWDFTSNDTTRFVVYDGGAGTSVILATGKWFTVDNTLLRVTFTGRANQWATSDVTVVWDYLYTVTSDDETYYHISFVDYEPGDFRMFKKTALGSGSSEVPGWIAPNMIRTDGLSLYQPPSNEATPIINHSLPQTAMNNFATQARNGVNLQVMSGATVEIYGISGNLVSRQNYASGMHFVSLAHLSKGMYVVKVRFGSNVKVLRVPVM
jgi:formylglycine-generating enzyme required for sulfatase activity